MRAPVLGFLCLTAPVLPAFAAGPLTDQSSAFLQAHADSPVHWMTWGEPAIQRARAENKPVFLAIGGFTSELSRAMRDQSFAREEVAALLNDNFICILVDRDDQPDLAALAQHYVGTVKQMQGWPLNLWLTPEFKPFDGATYLPPSDEWGKEGFTNAAKRVLAAWQADPAAQRAKADEAVAAQLAAATGTPPPVDAGAIKQLLADSTAGWMALYDAANGGFGDPPRYPQPELLRFFLQGDDTSRAAALKTLQAMAASPLCDPLDGGFFRYASDAEWKLPYLQKSAADQARIAHALLDAGAGRELTTRALDYALTLGDPARGFAAAEDGTPEKILPSFLWTAEAIHTAVGDRGKLDTLAAFGATAAGNLAADAYLGVETIGKNILFRPAPAWDQPWDPALQTAAKKLLEVRRTRPAPLRDDTATAGVHGQLLGAFARAGAELKEPRFTAAAAALFTFIRDDLRISDGGLHCRPGRVALASPRDHVLVIDGLLAHHAASGDTAARELALALLQELHATFGDSATGRFFNAPAPVGPGLWARVHAPAPDNADLPGAEAALLSTLVKYGIGEAATRDALAAGIARDVNESYNPARGDQLLALQAYVSQ